LFSAAQLLHRMPSMTLEAVYTFFNKMKLCDLPNSKAKLVHLAGNTSIEEALKTLGEYGIHGAPVTNDAHRVVGFTDYLDILAYLLAAPDMTAAFQDNVLLTVEKSGRDPLVLTAGDTKASMAVRVFAEGVQRIPTTGADGSIQGVLTQADMLRHFATNCDSNADLSAAAHSHLSQLHFDDKPLITVTADLTALECFQKIIANRIHSVPVLDGSGRLLAVVDATCLKGFEASTFTLLNLPVMEFLSKAAPQALTPAVVKQQDPFSEVVTKISAKGIHRVFLVDTDGKPLGVVTGTDVFRHIAHGLMLHAKGD